MRKPALDARHLISVDTLLHKESKSKRSQTFSSIAATDACVSPHRLFSACTVTIYLFFLKGTVSVNDANLMV